MTNTMMCNCCALQRLPDELSKLASWCKPYYPHYQNVFDFLERTTEPCMCDECLNNGNALKAHAELQNVPSKRATPFFAYWDQTIECLTCKRYFGFDKHEQQYWYEELKFPVFSQAKHCADFRETNREQKAEEAKLADMITYLDPTETDQLEPLIRLFLKRKNITKAKYYSSYYPKMFDYNENSILRLKHEELRALIGSTKPY
jgi:hypothetical protein